MGDRIGKEQRKGHRRRCVGTRKVGARQLGTICHRQTTTRVHGNGRLPGIAGGWVVEQGWLSREPRGV